MKILYLITKSNWGGAQKYVYDLATSFASYGHDVTVAFGGSGELSERLIQADIRTLSLDSLVRDISLIKELKTSFRLYSILRDERPDVLHANSSKAGGLGALFGRLAGVRTVVFTVHGAPFREDRPLPIRVVMYFFTWLTCLFAHKVIAVSNRDAHDVGRMPFVRNKVSMIYPGVVFNGQNAERSAPKTREVHLLTVAELHPNKGYRFGLEAINQLYKKGLPVRYTIFGEGQDRKWIEDYIKSHKLEQVVTLRGHDSNLHKELPNYDLFVLPSVKEGLPYTLIEAGRAMLPVVSTVTGGIPEIIRHEETGLLVKSKDVTQLALGLERLVTDRKLAKQLGIRLHSHVVQNFSHAKMITETAKVYGLIKAPK